jgi:hypothetical protein
MMSSYFMKILSTLVVFDLIFILAGVYIYECLPQSYPKTLNVLEYLVKATSALIILLFFIKILIYIWS